MPFVFSLLVQFSFVVWFWSELIFALEELISKIVTSSFEQFAFDILSKDKDAWE